MNTISGSSDNDIISGTSAADELFGGDGDDKLTGGAGNDVIYGGKGTDTATYSGVFSNFKVTALYKGKNNSFSGCEIYDQVSSEGLDTISSDVEYLSFSSGSVTYKISEGSLTLVGAASNTPVAGSANADFIPTTQGNDSIDAGAGVDTIVVSSAIINYTITKTATGYTLFDNTGADGTDTLVNVETIKFSDKTVNLTVQAKAASASSSSVTSLVELYVSFFNRIPDADGMSFWIDQIQAGRTINQIAENFYSVGINYSSFTGFSSSMTNTDFINVIYKNVLGRSDGADSEASTYWGAQLSSGLASRGSLVTDILYAAHQFKGDATWGWVANLLDNKIVVAKKFSIDLGLNYNTSEESIVKGMAIASLITSIDTSAAITLIGVSEENFHLTLN